MLVTATLGLATCDGGHVSSAAPDRRLRNRAQQLSGGSGDVRHRRGASLRPVTAPTVGGVVFVRVSDDCDNGVDVSLVNRYPMGYAGTRVRCPAHTMTVSLLALPLGVLIGISLGALGGGGSILTVPALVYALGESPRHATTASLIIVGVTALTGTLGHGRAGRVRWVPWIVFGAVGIGGSLVGSTLNRLVAPNLLLLAFAALMVFAAGAMYRRQRMAERAERHTETRDHVPSPGPGERAIGVVGVGTVVGFMTGFFGVGGGFVVVPGLVLALGFAMPEAVGTSLLVIAINSAAALAARGGVAAIDWSLVVPFTVAAMAGSLGGNRVAGRVPASILVRAFVVLLVLLAVYVAVRSSLGGS